MMGAEVGHGACRSLLIAPLVGDFRARQMSVATGSLIVLTIVTLAGRRLVDAPPRALLWVGLSWLALTVAFELALGRLVFGLEWSRLAADYDVPRGGLLPFGLLVLAASPMLARGLRRALGANTRMLRRA